MALSVGCFGGSFDVATSKFSYFVLSLTQTISAIDLMENIFPVISFVFVAISTNAKIGVHNHLFGVDLLHSERTEMRTTKCSYSNLLTIGSILVCPA